MEFRNWIIDEGFWDSFRQAYHGGKHKKPPMTEKEALHKGWEYLKKLHNDIQGSKAVFQPELKDNLEDALKEVILSVFHRTEGFVQPEALDVLAHFVFGIKMYSRPMSKNRIGNIPDLNDLPTEVPANLFVDPSNAEEITQRSYHLSIFNPYHIFERLQDILRLHSPINQSQLRTHGIEWANIYFPTIVRSGMIQHQKLMAQQAWTHDPLSQNTPDPEDVAKKWFIENFNAGAQINSRMMELLKLQEAAIKRGIFDPRNPARKYNMMKENIESLIGRLSVPQEVKFEIAKLLNLKYFNVASDPTGSNLRLIKI